MTKSQIFTYLYNTVIVLLLLAGITYVVLQFTHFGHIEYTDNARVCQYIAPQNTRVQGFIKEIRFEAYQHVREGDTLVIIEDSEFRLRLAQAKSDLARAQQQSKSPHKRDTSRYVIPSTCNAAWRMRRVITAQRWKQRSN